MKLVIEIPDGCDVSKIQNGSIASKKIMDAVRNGIPLPKGHGDLVDKKDLLDDTCLDEIPTILEADKAESEDAE